MNNMEPQPVASSLVVTNDDREELIVCVEPWGFELALGNRESAKVIIRAPSLEPTGVRSQQGRITLEFLGAGNATLEVWVRGERIH